MADVERLSDSELLGTWQMFRDAVGALDVRLNGMLNEGPDVGLVAEALVRLMFETDCRLQVTKLVTGLGLSSGSGTKFVDGLEEGGLVGRRRSGTDRRVVWVELTEAGRVEAARVLPGFTRTLRAELAGVGVDRLRALHAVCAEIERAS